MSVSVEWLECYFCVFTASFIVTFLICILQSVTTNVIECFRNEIMLVEHNLYFELSSNYIIFCNSYMDYYIFSLKKKNKKNIETIKSLINYF